LQCVIGAVCAPAKVWVIVAAAVVVVVAAAVCTDDADTLVTVRDADDGDDAWKLAGEAPEGLWR